MPFYIANHLQECEGLDHVEAHFLILMRAHIWTHGPIPNKPAVLAKVCKWEAKRVAKRAAKCLTFFELKDGCWTDEAILAERAKAQHRREVARKNGSKGGRPNSNPAGSFQESHGETSIPIPSNYPLPESSVSSTEVITGGVEIWEQVS